jgi:predicted ester cyclase
MRSRFLPLAACALLVIACGENEAGEATEHEGMAAETMADNSMAEANMALQREAFDAVASGNLDAIDAHLAAGYTYHGPSGPPRDAAGTKAQVSEYVKAFPDLKFTVDFQFANGEYTAARLVVTGTNTGPMGDMAPTGKPVSVTITNIMRIVDGKIVEEWENFDELGMMQQIGLIPQQ